jgi:host cell surface-exposed lipoprotein
MKNVVKKSVISLFAVCLLLIVGSAIISSMPVEPAAVTLNPSATVDDSLTEDGQPIPPKVAKVKMTVSQEQALESAKMYLGFSGFSKAGLMRQLTSDAGEDFSEKDAKFALAHVKVNWNNEAVETAKTYLEMSSFSRAGLIRQLSSSSGDQFTAKQAKFAADKVGL